MTNIIAFTRDSTLRSEIDKWVERELHNIAAIIAVSFTVVGKMVITYRVTKG